VANIFLTGATGYAGQCVLPELLARGHLVTALVRKPTALYGCRTVVGDLAAVGSYASEFADRDAFVHLASSRSLEESIVLREDVLGTNQLVHAWRRGPFVYASTPTVYGVAFGALSERSPVDPIDWYDLARLANEFQLRVAGPPNSRGPAISLRPAVLFAANDRRRERQFLSQLIDACALGRTFAFDSEESASTAGCSFIGGGDFGRAVADALAIKAAGAYNIASGFCTWHELIDAVNRATGSHGQIIVRSSVEPTGDVLRLPQISTMLDTTAFGRETGFVPRQSLEGLVDEFVRAERGASRTQPASG
jgi:nucleoside-diphosphate-sugar epimerase